VRANIAAVAIPGALALGQDVGRLVAAPPPGSAQPPYDLVYVDPPYDLADDVVEAALEGLAAHGWLAEESLVLVERSRRGAGFGWPEGCVAERDRTYGDTLVRSALWYGRDA
jgi:16S rRNA (guanine966-N2)-methyltransferase